MDNSNMSHQTQQRFMQLVSDPLWKGKPFWLLNLFKFRRDEDGSTTTAQASFRRYLRGAQQHAQKATGESWFKGARIVSLNCHSVFPGSHGEWDAVVMYEYPSPESLMQLVVSNKEFKQVSKDRDAAVAKMSQVAVKPTILNLVKGGIPEDLQQQAKAFADDFWMASQNSKQPQTGEEVAKIWPEPEAVLPLFQSKDDKQMLRSNPFMALNLLTFKRNKDIRDGRAEYAIYGEHVQRLIQENLPQPCGLCCCFTPCMTLNGEIDWDEMLIMQYPHLKAFAGLTSVPGYMDGGEHREKGLLYQGLVLMEPQLLNGKALGGRFRVADGGDSVGLPEAEPTAIPSRL